jgi:hypothetical protein
VRDAAGIEGESGALSRVGGTCEKEMLIQPKAETVKCIHMGEATWLISLVV